MPNLPHQPQSIHVALQPEGKREDSYYLNQLLQGAEKQEVHNKRKGRMKTDAYVSSSS